MSSENLPSYTPEVLPRYDLTPTTSRSTQSSAHIPHTSLLARGRNQTTYKYTSEHMTLDLGARRWGTYLPAYGRNGHVEGTVTVRSLKHVDRIVVRIIGKAVTSNIVNHVPTFSQTHMLLHKSTELWSSNTASSSTQPVPAEFPFSFTLSERERNLPPSSSIQLRKASAYTAYAVRVDMYRRGVYLHESVQTEILYLPRTTSRYSRPFVPSADPTNEKRRQMDASQWHRIGPSPGLLLPRELQYPAGQTIPFIIIPNPDTLSSPIPDVELVRIRTANTRTGVVQKREVIACGQQVDIGPDEMINGVIEVGDEREIGWEAPGVGGVSFQYEIRFGDEAERIELVSHEWREENAVGLPALELEAAGRRALNLIDMSV
ncbi:hypothetical protein FRC12_016776 [Ceratobasidium sp. 428]|nr:hypothetical protein FRC12_016776 [Ceratobasidium sp. 428]